MNPINHFLTGWVVANADRGLNRRERLLITAAGVIPDADGFGIVAEALTRNGDHPLLWWTNYHHVLFHNIFFAAAAAAVSSFFATKRLKTAALVFLSLHLHLIGDILSGKGPDGSVWTVSYLMPFSRTFEVSWNGQLELNAWPNFVFAVTLLALTFFLAWRRGYSPLEMVSSRADRAFVQTLRQRFSALTS